MKIIYDRKAEEYPVHFKLDGGGIVLDAPPVELLVCLCGMTHLPIDGARLPNYPVPGLLIATTTDPEISPDYGENECCVDVEYTPAELAELNALYDHL